MGDDVVCPIKIAKRGKRGACGPKYYARAPAGRVVDTGFIKDAPLVSCAAEHGDVLGELIGRGGFAGDHGDLVGEKLATYLDKKRAEADDFGFLCYWARKASPTVATDTEKRNPAGEGLVHLALLARLYHSIRSTSCQAERTSSCVVAPDQCFACHCEDQIRAHELKRGGVYETRYIVLLFVLR